MSSFRSSFWYKEGCVPNRQWGKGPNPEDISYGKGSSLWCCRSTSRLQKTSKCKLFNSILLIFLKSNRVFIMVVIVCSWIYNYLCNQCLSPLKLWVQPHSWRCVLDTALCDKVCWWLATGRWFSPGTPVASTNKTDYHDITEILLKVALNTKNQNQTKPKSNRFRLYDFLANKTAMRLDKKLSQLMDCPLPTNNTQ